MSVEPLNEHLHRTPSRIPLVFFHS